MNWTEEEIVDIVRRPTRYNQLSAEARQEVDRRFANFIDRSDDEEGDLDEDFLPNEEASDVESVYEIENDIRGESDEDEIDLEEP